METSIHWVIPMLLDGLHVPLTTPFYRDGALYYRKLEHNVGRLSLTPASGLIAFGFGAEAQAISDGETAESLRVIADTAAKEKVLIARVERGSVAASLAVADQASAAGFDVVLLPVPTLWQKGALAALYLRSIADRSPLPIALWSGDCHAHAALSPEVIAELAQHPNVLGMYDVALTAGRFRALREATAGVQREATVTTVFAPVTGRMLQQNEPQGRGDFVSAEALSGGIALAAAPPKPALKTRTRSVGFQILGAGSTQGICDLLEAGAPGVSPLLAAAAPQAVYEVLAAWKDGNPELAKEKQERLTEPDAACVELGLAAFKYAGDLNGYFGGVPRLPYLPLNAEGRLAIETAFRYVRN